ncbi:protein of unknown function [Candidatus Methylomirabilis oxygeniifera]|uniref:Uncharacterized protein n=1 Tax=Methylomirabilis oxygeniifera TaxID=671143 RepID=D5MMQ6_METO1|nr:protein of unknown function [Candidatus Methylomirabilis oxyfera]
MTICVDLPALADNQGINSVRICRADYARRYTGFQGQTQTVTLLRLHPLGPSRSRQ